VPDRTEWHSLVAWRGLADTIEKYVKKGDKLYVEGELRYREYESKDGIKRRVAEIYLDKMEMLTPKGDGKPLPPMPEEPAGMQGRSTSPESTAAAPQQAKVDFSGDDDMPF
jgi:single-strand DNA-binding protein